MKGQPSPCLSPTPTPRAGVNTWAHKGKNRRKHDWSRRDPPLGGDSPQVPPTAPDKNPRERLPSPPGHPSPAGRLTTCSGARAPATVPGLGRGPRWPRWRVESGSPLPAPPDHPSIQPEPARSPSPANFPPLTTPWTRNSKSLLFVALRAPPATSSAAIGVGSAAPLTLSLFLFLSLFCLFFFPPTLPSESCWALSHFYSCGVGRGPLQGCPDGPRPTPPPPPARSPPRLPHSCTDKTEIVRRPGVCLLTRRGQKSLPFQASLAKQRR